MAWGDVIVPSKQMRVTVQNFGYNRGN